MTIVSIEKGTDGELARIKLSDGSFFSFRPCYLPSIFVDTRLYTPGASEGLEISPDESAGFRFASACLRAEKAALRLIARAEQTVFGISRKLERRGHDSACVYQVVARLGDLELLDDRRYARLWVESRLAHRASSPRLLVAGLCSRGIDRSTAEAALKAALTPEAEAKLLERFVHKLKRSRKFKKAAASAAEKSSGGAGSLKFILKGEGFTSQIIQEFLEVCL